MFKLNENGELLLLIDPQTPKPPSADFLLKALSNSVYAEFKIQHSQIKQLFSTKDTPAQTVIANKVNAQLEVTISDDKMHAIGKITTAQGGELIDLATAKTILVKAGVSRGYKQSLLENLLQQQLEKPSGCEVEVTLAKGKAPVPGSNAVLVKKVPTLSERLAKPKELEGGRVDMRDFGKLASVEPGVTVMELIEPVPGIPGYTVTGETLTPQEGKPLKMTPGDGTEISPTNPKALVSTRAGVPIEINNGMRVDNIFTIKDVSVKTGHIQFNGSVLITHNIDPGMKVTANGNIIVMGTVDSAILEAEGDITVNQAVIGHLNHDHETLSCQLISKGDIKISHCQYAYINAKNIYIAKQANHCNLKADNLIKIGTGDKPLGKLMGGKVIDALQLQVGELGCDSDAKIELSLIQKAFNLSSKSDEILKQITKTDKQLEELQQALEKIECIKDLGKKKAYLEKISHNHTHWMEQAEQYQKELMQYDNHLHELLDSAAIKIYKILHSGIELHIFDKVLQVKRNYPPCEIHLVEDKIKIEFKT